jgi:ribosomal protein L11 methyltransferase
LAEAPALDVAFLASPGPDAVLRERLYALLDDFEPLAIHEDDSGDTWRVFFHSAAQRDAAATHVNAAVASHLLRTSAVDVRVEDWARRSQQNLTSIDVGGLVIAPPWDVPRGISKPVIIIEPSMGFGTGHHATTRLCLRLLQEVELRGTRVVDVGTGSGVLALAAWKLGASDVVAIDNDPDALESARDNIARNGGAAAIGIIGADLSSLKVPQADLVLANLTAAVLVRHAATLLKLTRYSGFLILSGFATDHLFPDIRPAFEGTHEIKELVEGEWSAICLQRTAL